MRDICGKRYSLCAIFHVAKTLLCAIFHVANAQQYVAVCIAKTSKGLSYKGYTYVACDEFLLPNEYICSL